MIQQLVWSLVFRPYVTLFLCAFLALSCLEQGKRRTLIWLISSYFVAWGAEWSSINFGFPFGWYVYHYDVLENDLIVFGVPFFDSLSFTFLSYVSFSFAQFFLSPRRGRNSRLVLLLGAALMVVIDLIVDPVANLGKYWFLGDIYHYIEPGLHFGVPLMNYGGWFIVATVTIFINQRVDEYLTEQERLDSRPLQLIDVPYKCVFAPVLWFGIALFQLGVTYWLVLADIAMRIDSEHILLLALTGSFIIAPILLLTIVQFVKRAKRAGELVPVHGQADASCSDGQPKAAMAIETEAGHDKGSKSTHS